MPTHTPAHSHARPYQLWIGTKQMKQMKQTTWISEKPQSEIWTQIITAKERDKRYYLFALSPLPQSFPGCRGRYWRPILVHTSPLCYEESFFFTQEIQNYKFIIEKV